MRCLHIRRLDARLQVKFYKRARFHKEKAHGSSGLFIHGQGSRGTSELDQPGC